MDNCAGALSGIDHNYAPLHDVLFLFLAKVYDTPLHNFLTQGLKVRIQGHSTSDNILNMYYLYSCTYAQPGNH